MAYRWTLIPALFVLLAGPAHAADPVRYSLAIAPTGDAALDRTLAEIATLATLRDSAPAGPLALIARARADAARFADALASLGHYAGTVRITIAGADLDAPDLADRLDAAADDETVPIAARIDPGPLYRLRRIRLRGDAAGIAAPPGLAPGQPAIAADVLAAGERLRTALRAEGHALATVGPPDAVLVPGADALDVTFPVAAGPRVDLGEITLTGLSGLREDSVRARLGLAPGMAFDPARLAAARADLLALPAIAGAGIVEGTALDASGRLPLTIAVTERKPRAIRLEGAWSTDQGGSLSATWLHRNLMGGGEQLALSAAAIDLGGGATRAPGYVLGAGLTLPDWRAHGQSLELKLGAAQEYLRAYDRRGVTAAATLRRTLDPGLTASAGILATQERITQEGTARDYTLLQTPLGLTSDSTTDKLDPASGHRATLAVTPSLSLGGAGTQAFLVAQASAATYLDLGATPGRSILAARALLGATEGAGVLDLPPDQRFYAGGGGSIRGYAYQTVGRLFASGKPVGGSAVDIASIEFRQRIGADWGMVGFLDAGQLGENGHPFDGALRAGAGIGVRYYTGLGPLRLDIAIPLIHQRKTGSVQIYAGLGQAF